MAAAQPGSPAFFSITLLHFETDEILCGIAAARPRRLRAPTALDSTCRLRAGQTPATATPPDPELS
jgi:hypothetical protein